MLDRLRLERVKANTVVFRQGDTEDTCFYMILSGKVEVWTREPDAANLRRTLQRLPDQSAARSSPGDEPDNRGRSGAGFSPLQSPKTKKKAFQLGLAPIEVESVPDRQSVFPRRSSRPSPAEGKPPGKAYSILSSSRRVFESPRLSAQKKSVFAKDAQSQQLDSEEELSPLKVASERKLAKHLVFGEHFPVSPARKKPLVLRKAEPLQTLRVKLASTVRPGSAVRPRATQAEPERLARAAGRVRLRPARPAAEHVSGAGAAVCVGADPELRRKGARAGRGSFA